MSLVLAFLASFSLMASTAKFPKDWKLPFWFPNLYIQAGCKVYNLGGDKIANFPGGFCQFFSDGSFLAMENDYLRYFNVKREIVWSVTGNFHHQLNLSNDKLRALTLSWKIHEVDGKNVRTDYLHVINIADGKILHEISAPKLLAEKYPLSKTPLGFNSKFEVRAEYESSHFNSIYEIPKLNPGGKVPTYIKEGNIVANSIELGTFIITPDLKEVLHHQKFGVSVKHQVHDVQVLPSGYFLLFNNVHSQEKNPFHYSTVNIVAPGTDENLWEFSATPGSMFYSEVAGGAQLLNGNLILFSGILGGTYIIHRDTKTLVFYQPRTHMDRDRPLPHQDVKGVYIGEFLLHWQKGY